MTTEQFTRYKLDEEKALEEDLVFSVRLNKEEQAWLEEIKKDLNIKANSKALKVAAFIGKNVLQSIFGRKFLRYLFKKERIKLDDM